MTSEETYELLTSVFRQVFRRDDIVLYPEMTAKDLVGWDSIMHVDILMEIESRLDCEFEPMEIDQLVNVKDLAVLVAQKSGAP
jgi:acyl carrier protein